MGCKRRQRGITLSGLIFGCVLLGFIALVGMKLFPLYNEKMKVDFALEKVAGTPGSTRLSKSEAVQQVLKQFEVSDVDRFNTPELTKILKINKMKTGGGQTISMTYEIRGPLFDELDVVLKYNREIAMSAGGAE